MLWWLGFAQMTPGSPGGPGQPGGRPNPRPTPQVHGAAPPPPPGQIPPDELEEEEQEESEVGAVLADLMPWAVSILLHAAIVLIAILWIFMTIPTIEDKAPIVPVARLSEKPGMPMQLQTTNEPTKASSSKRTISKTEKVTTLEQSKVKVDLNLLGVTGGNESKANPFGAGVGIGGPFKSGFFGSGGNAKRIVYIVDASGSLIDTLPFVFDELKRSINDLSEAQHFSIMFFQGPDFVELPPAGRLKNADSDKKTAAKDWLDSNPVMPHGKAGGGSIQALKKALSYKPDLIYLLSDNITGQGEYEIMQEEFVAAVAQANKSNTKINTIQFLYPDKLAQYPGMEPTLKIISKESGGQYKFVGGRELGIVR